MRSLGVLPISMLFVLLTGCPNEGVAPSALEDGGACEPPCLPDEEIQPVDGGTGSDGGTSARPAGLYFLRVDEGVTGAPGSVIARSEFYDPKNADDEAKVKTAIDYESAFNVPTSPPVGSCVAGDATPTQPDNSAFPQGALFVDLGPKIDVAEAENGPAVFSLNRQGNEATYYGSKSGKMTGFQFIGTGLAARNGYVLPASRHFSLWPHGTFGFADGGTITRSAGFTTTYGPVAADAYRLVIGGGGGRITCALNPAGGTLNIASALLGALPAGSTRIELSMRGRTTMPMTVDGQPRSAVTFRVLSFAIGGTLN